MGRRGRPPEFQRKVLDLIEAGRSTADVAHDLESEQSIYTRRRQERFEPWPAGRADERREGRADRGAQAHRRPRSGIGRQPASSRAAEGGGPPKRRFAAAEVMAAEHLPVQLVCRVLDFSESGYYDRKTRAPSQRAIRHAWLRELIRQIHLDSRRTYDSRRVHADLLA